MNRRRAIVGLCMLCALLASAFAVQSASAITGTTAWTCVKGEAFLRGEHCLTTGTAAPDYGHKKIDQDKTTELITTNAKTEDQTFGGSTGRLKMTIAGIPLELGFTGASGSGWMENKITAGGEHYAHGEGALTFTGVAVTIPAGRGCRVYTHKEDGSGNPGEEGEEGVVHSREPDSDDGRGWGQPHLQSRGWWQLRELLVHMRRRQKNPLYRRNMVLQRKRERSTRRGDNQLHARAGDNRSPAEMQRGENRN